MLRAVTIRILALAACGWLLAGPAGALTLGRARGAALIGRPLEVTVPVTLDGPASDAPCASADLFYGDTRVAGSTVRFEAAGPGQGLLRVLSDALIDEPLVTIYLNVGCKDASTRRYVLLSELPPADEPAVRVAPALVPPVLAAAPAAAPAARGTSSRRRDIAASAPPVTAATPATPATPAPLQRERGTSRGASPVTPPPAVASRARRSAPRAQLKLEPLDLGVERDPVLRLSPELGLPTGADAQRREALAGLWQAMQRSPEQAIEDVVRLKALQTEIASVRETTRQNAAALAQMRGQVEQARRYGTVATALVAALAVVLLVLLAALGWRWRRVHQLDRVGRWFEVNGSSVQGHLPTAPEAPRPVAAATTRPAPVTPSRSATVGVPMPPAAPVVRRSAAPAAARTSTWGAGEEFGASRGGPMRMVGVEELIDVHDKADFFLSIGETEQALALLEAHVHDQVETGALAWMDLLELYHSLGRRSEFERLRNEFRHRFTAQVPDFEHFDQPSASLENYSRALSRIVALWPARKVLDVIEESIFRKPGVAGAEPFSLEAYRELVLLYHIARDMAPEAQAEGQATTFTDTALQPLNMADRPEEEPLSEREKLMIPPASSRLGVDIDLGETEPADARDLRALDFDISTFDPGNVPDTAGKRG